MSYFFSYVICSDNYQKLVNSFKSQNRDSLITNNKWQYNGVLNGVFFVGTSTKFYVLLYVGRGRVANMNCSCID